MRTARILGLVAMTIVIMALCGGNASATVFCKTNTTPCGSQVSAGTKVEMSLSGASVMKAVTTDECGGSEWTWKVENAGGSSSTVSGKVENLNFSSCSCETKVLKPGEVEAHWVGGTMNGTLTSKSAEVTTKCTGVDCVYGTGGGTSIGTLTGGEAAKLDVSATLAKISGSLFCPSTASWTATYEVKAPKPLYVAEYMSGEGPTSTSLTTSLSGEAKSGEEITVNEGSKVKDTATLSGTNASKATGTVKYKVYADKECKELVTSAGEVTVTSGSVPASEEKTLEAGRVYYWQAEYSGDSNNLASTSTCGKEVLTVKANTSLTTILRGEPPHEAVIEGKEISLPQGVPAVDAATLEGTKATTATGKVKFKVYADSGCKELVAEAGEASAVEGSAGPSAEIELGEGKYYWQATYEGDSLHQASTSSCSSEVLTVKAATYISTILADSEESGGVIAPEEVTAVTDTATLSGAKASTATGKVKYRIYADPSCEELVTEAGEGTVSGTEVEPSEPETLEPGVYYWQAEYSGDAANGAVATECGAAIEENALANVTLREVNAGGAALAPKTTVKGSSKNLVFTAYGGQIFECEVNSFEGEVLNNANDTAVVELTSWEFENGGAEPPKCRTSMKVGGKPVDAVLTALVPGTLRFPTNGLARLANFEVKMQLYVNKVLELTCRYGTFDQTFGFTFNEPLGLKFSNIYVLYKWPGSEAKCGKWILPSGLFTVTTKVGNKAVVPTTP
jgi:hypothetical protein